MTTHAILTRVDEKKYVVWFRNGGFFDEFPSLFNLVDLCAYVIQMKITHLWVHPDTRVHIMGGSVDRLKELGFDCLATYAGQDDNELASLYAFQKYTRGQSHRFTITFLEHSSWDWQTLSIAEIFETIEDLEINLEVSVGSPSTTGMRYLLQKTRKRPQWLVKPETDLSRIPWNEGARPLVWQREPSTEELACKYVYAFDKNNAHGREAKEEEFGYGEPEYRTENVQFDPSLPGMWYVVLSPPVEPSDYESDLLPSPVWQYTGAIWLATPLVKLLQRIGYGFEILEAWVFPKHAHIYRGWIEDLYELRREREGHLKDAYKSVINETLGLLRSDKVGTDSFKYRPDHYMQIVAGTRATMMYNMISYAKKGYYPLMCQLDALYYCSDHENSFLAVQGILDHSNSLGGYKLKFKIPMDEKIESLGTVRTLLASALPQSKKLRHLNYLAHQLGY